MAAKKEKEVKVYKIRHRVSGLWSKGGSMPTFNRVGKTWSNIGHLKNHLNCLSVCVDELANWEIVEFVLKPEETGITNVVEGMEHHWFCRFLLEKYTQLRYYNDVLRDEKKMSNKAFAFVFKETPTEFYETEFYENVIRAIDDMGLADDVYISPRTYYHGQIVLCKNRDTAMKLRIATDGATLVLDLDNERKEFRRKFKIED